MTHEDQATSYGGAVLLIGVDVMGIKRRGNQYHANAKRAKAAYAKFNGELNKGIEDSRVRCAIHALTDDNDWPKYLPSVAYGRTGVVSDRSCDPSRCDCQVLGFPIHSDALVPSC